MDKTCRTCKDTKPLMEFYQQNNGNLYGDCKECYKARVRKNRELNVEYYRQFDRDRAMLPHRVEARSEYARTERGRERVQVGKRAYIARNPIKRHAHHQVNNAIRDGKLTRKPCEVCGHEKAQAHHDDYSKPLDVRWLCTTHHAEWHKHNTPLCPEQTEKAA